LQKDPETSLYVIKLQEDFYQPEDIAALLPLPAFATKAIYVGKRAGAFASNINAWVFKNIFGIWKPKSTVGTRKAD